MRSQSRKNTYENPAAAQIFSRRFSELLRAYAVLSCAHAIEFAHNATVGGRTVRPGVLMER